MLHMYPYLLFTVNTAQPQNKVGCPPALSEDVHNSSYARRAIWNRYYNFAGRRAFLRRLGAGVLYVLLRTQQGSWRFQALGVR